MWAECMGIPDAVRDAEKFAVVLGGEPRSDKRPALTAGFDYEHGIGYADHEPIAFGEVMHARERVRRVLAYESATGLEYLLCKCAIAPGVEDLVTEARAREDSRMES